MSEPAERERLVTGPSGRVFLTISVGWLLIQMGRQVIPPLLPNVIDDLAITSTQAGLALTLMWGLYALCQYPSGRLSDRLTRKTLVVSGLSLVGAGFLAVWLTTSYPTFVFGVAVAGLGAGLYPTAARALVSDLFVERRGQAFGIHTASGDLGNAAAAGLAVVAVTFATWQEAFLPLVVLLGCILAAVHWWGREEYALESVELGITATLRRLFGDPRLRWLLVAYALFAFTWQSATGFLPSLLQFEKGFSVGFASAGFAFYFLVGTAVKPVAGLLGDRFGRTTVALAALGLALAGLVSSLVVEITLLVFLSIGVFAAGLMSFPPVMQAFFMDIFPDDSMGGDLGAMRSLYVGFGSLGPTYVGYAAELVNYLVAFAGLVACLFASAAILVVIEVRS